MFNLFKKKEEKKMGNEENKSEFVENKELTVIENIEDLKEPNSETGYLMEFEEIGKGTEEEELEAEKEGVENE